MTTSQMVVVVAGAPLMVLVTLYVIEAELEHGRRLAADAENERLRAELSSYRRVATVRDHTIEALVSEAARDEFSRGAH